MSQDVKFVVKIVAEAIIKNEQYFSELDGVVGDGDFGNSLARGFEKVLQEWDTMAQDMPGDFLKKVSAVIVREIGGVSGSIWGTAFLRAGMSLGTKTEITSSDVILLFRAAIEGIKKRGKSDLGDKTLLDALVPAVDTLEKTFNEGKDSMAALAAATVAAREAAEATRAMVAKRGRASYTGERSIGSLDAGAEAVSVLFAAVNKACEK